MSDVRRGFVIVGLLCSALLAAAAAGAAAQSEGAVSEIVITGNKNINQQAILDLLQLKPGVPFESAKMQADRSAIEKMGFFAAVSAKDEQTPSGVKVTFEVLENPVVQSIVFKGNTVFTHEQLLAVMRTKVGQVYNMNTIEQDVDAIAELYKKERYLAYVTTDAEISPEGVLTLPILEFRVGKIQFEGLKKTKPKILLREMELKSGALYNAGVLQKDITTIYERDWFDVEKMENPRTTRGAEDGVLDITIPLQEKKTGQISAGLGYSSLQKVVGRVEVSESNFQGRGLGVNAMYEVSGSGTGSSWELGYFDPWFRPNRTSLNVNVYNKAIYRFSSSAFGGSTNIAEDADYRERRRGGSIGLARPVTKTVRVFLTGRYDDVSTSLSDDVVVDPGLIAVEQDGTVTSLALRGAFDTRDFALDPAMGTYTSLTWEPGISRVNTLDSNTFTKLYLDARQYFSPGGRKQTVKDRRTTLAGRLQAGWSTGFLPFWEQFFVGGAERLRGYREDRFWGNRMLLASLEYRVPLSGGLSGVAFLDYGDAWGEGYQDVSKEFTQSTSFKGHAGYGLGIRVSTPIGNLRFDYGIGDEGSRTHFSIGQAF